MKRSNGTNSQAFKQRYRSRRKFSFRTYNRNSNIPFENKKDEFTAQVKIEKKKYSWENLVSAIEELYEESITIK